MTHTKLLKFAFILTLTIALGLMNTSVVQAAKNPRYASLIMDADTGLILHQRYADKKLHPASLTKVMTLIMIFDAIDQGRLNLNDRLYISKHAASMVPSKLGLSPGSSIRVKDAISILVTKSANDIAVAVAEKIGGNERNFARMMTNKARSFGMRSTVFKNASGLHNPAQVSTARDMGKMAQILIKDYPREYRYFSAKSFTYQGKTYRSHNRLMSSYPGMDGLKTGYVGASGFNLIASAVRNNRRIIGVVFGGRTSRSRNDHMASLLDKGFGKVNNIRIAHAKPPVPAHKPATILASARGLNTLSPANGRTTGSQKWASLNATLKHGKIGQVIGEGDYDPAVSRRFETGMMAIAAHRNEAKTVFKQAAPALQKASFSQRKQNAKNLPWAIQIGAFTNRQATNRAIQTAQKKLPPPYGRANAVIAPLRTKNGWLFRGRLSGYTQAQAFAACYHLKDCLPVAPYN